MSLEKCPRCGEEPERWSVPNPRGSRVRARTVFLADCECDEPVSAPTEEICAMAWKERCSSIYREQQRTYDRCHDLSDEF